MKKIAVLFVTIFVVLVLSHTGYAEPPKLEFKASGMFDVQTFLTKNVPPYGIQGFQTSSGIYNVVSSNYNSFTGAPFYSPNKALNRTASYWQQSAHIKFEFLMGKELSATAMFEIDSTRWGDIPGGQGGKLGDNGTLGFWSADRATVEVKNLFIDATLPSFGLPVPMSVRLGVQPLAIRPNVFVYTDGAGITGGIKLDQLTGVPVSLIPYYFKSLEGVDWTADDCDVWGLQAKATFGKVTVGGYNLKYNMNTYPFLMIAPVPTLPQSLWPYVQGPFKADMSWWGVYMDGAAGPFNFNFDFIYDHGKVEKYLIFDEVKYQGWMTRLKLDFPWEKFNFGAIGMYATGADTRETNSNGFPVDPSSGATSSKVTSFVVPPGSEEPLGNGESVVVYSMEPGATGGAGLAATVSYVTLGRGAFGGTWFGKLYASYKPVPFYKMTLQGLYVGDTTKNGNTLGTAIIPGTTTLRDDKQIGYELDLLNEIYLYSNLRFWVGAGYLWKGPALDLRRGTLRENFSYHNPWAIRTRLVYFF